MSERPGPDIEHVRDAMREHDERQEDEPERDEAETDEQEDSEQDAE